MNKNDYVDVFNKFLQGITVNFEEKLLPIILEYLTDVRDEKEIPLLEKQIRENPQMVTGLIPRIIEHMRRKYYIFSIIKNNKPILFYVTD